VDLVSAGQFNPGRVGVCEFVIVGNAIIIVIKSGSICAVIASATYGRGDALQSSVVVIGVAGHVIELIGH